MIIKKMLRPLLLGGVISCISIAASAQEVALKNNILYDATTTPNIGLEIGLGKRTTAQVFYGLNPWEFSSDTHGDRQAKHWVVMPELRWWTCSKFNGFFYGIHAMGGQFNAGNIDIPMPGAFVSGDNLRTMVKDSRVEGNFVGGGVTLGYQFILSRHWNLEVEAGAGYDHIWYEQYPCGDCGTQISKGSSNYVGLTKLGLSFLYIF